MNGRSLKKGRNNNCARIVFFQSRFTFLPPKILSTFLWKGKKEEKNIKMELRNLIKIYFSSCYSSKDFIPFFHVLHKDQLGRFIQIWKVGLLSEKCLVWCWELLVARLRPRFRRLLLKKEKKKKVERVDLDLFFNRRLRSLLFFSFFEVIQWFTTFCKIKTKRHLRALYFFFYCSGTFPYYVRLVFDWSAMRDLAWLWTHFTSNS